MTQGCRNWPPAYVDWLKSDNCDRLLNYKIMYETLIRLKVHKNENFFGLDFEFCPISLLVMHK